MDFLESEYSEACNIKQTVTRLLGGLADRSWQPDFLDWRETVCVCVCLTILNITTGTTNGARKTTCTCCCPGVAQTHTSEAGEAAALQSPSRPSWAFQPTEVTEEKLEFFSIFILFFSVGLEEVDRATNCFHIQTVWGHGWADVPSMFAFFLFGSKRPLQSYRNTVFHQLLKKQPLSSVDNTLNGCLNSSGPSRAVAEVSFQLIWIVHPGRDE